MRSPTCFPSASVDARRQGDLVECVDARESTVDHRRPVLREEPAVEASEHTGVPKVVNDPAADNRERVEADVRRAAPNPRKACDRIDTQQVWGERVDGHVAQLHVTLIRRERRGRTTRTSERGQSEAAEQADRKGQRPDRPPGAAVRPPDEERGPQQEARRTARRNGKLRARSTRPSSTRRRAMRQQARRTPRGVPAPPTATFRLGFTQMAPPAEHQAPRRPSDGSALQNMRTERRPAG